MKNTENEISEKVVKSKKDDRKLFTLFSIIVIIKDKVGDSDMKQEKKLDKLDKMREIKQKREIEIKNTGKNIQIKDIYDQGRIYWIEEQNGEKLKTEKEIYLLLEQSLDQYENIIRIEKYYTEDFDCIAGNREGDQYDLMLEEDYSGQEELLEELKNLKKQKDLGLKGRERERRQKIAQVWQREKEQIDSITEIDLKQEINSSLTNRAKQDFTKTTIKRKGLNIKEETNLNQYVKGKTLENLLGLEKIGITDGVKLARVTTTSLNKNQREKVTTQDAFVVIRANGDVVPLGEDILKPDDQLGNNPREGSLTSNIDGSVRKENITSSFLIVNGNGRQYLQIGYDENLGKEIKYTMRSNEKGEDVSQELSTQRTYYQNSEVRQFMLDRNVGIKEAKEMLERDTQHANCEKRDITLIDADKDNDSHKHIAENYIQYANGKKVTYQELATRWGLFRNGKPDVVFVKDKIEKQKQEQPEETMEKIVEDLDQEFSDPRLPEKEIR